ncbi:MAG: nucleotidyltransferase domain-containing protein [bacterium]|nr:nucleotidyltransferase domain-containing protein [bacterium]
MYSTSPKKAIEEFTAIISREFNPEKIILFGSHAWGKPHKDSDIDLVVIKKTTRSTREVAREIDGALWGRKVALDIIVMTPVQVKKRMDMGDFFVGDILKKGKILYAKKAK